MVIGFLVYIVHIVYGPGLYKRATRFALLKRYNPRTHNRIPGDLLIKSFGLAAMAAAVWMAFWYAQPFNTVAIDMTLTGNNYPVSTITGERGQQIRLTLKNADQAVHMFEIDEIDTRFLKMVRKGSAEEHRVTPGVVDPGKSGSIEFTPTRAGVYEFYCGVPGHRQDDMVGTLIVN